MSAGTIERVLRKDKLIVLAAVSVIILLAGIYTVLGVGMDMSAHEMTRGIVKTETGMDMGSMAVWTPGYAVLVVFMWWFMMIAMMTPSAAPTLLLFTALKRQGTDRMSAPIYSAVFLSGYLLIWALFAILAALLQWILGASNLLSNSAMTITSNTVAGLVLVSAGLYQFSNLKNVCLEHCKSPYTFLIENHIKGLSGALRMGVNHGIYCLGCCWALMALLFVGGIMNLYWIVGLAIYVVAEKHFSNNGGLASFTGTALILAGVMVLIST